MEPLAELRRHVQGGKLIIGKSEVLRLLRHNGLAKVFAASNCDASMMDDLRNYCSLSGCELVELSVPNDELGVLCKKPFSIAVAGVPK